MAIPIKTKKQQEKMRTAGRLAAEVLEMIEPYVIEGITTNELDRICHDYIINVQQAIPAPLNYHGFPKSICTSVNYQVCHGIPNNKCLKKNDILNIDITVIKDGFHGDTSKMFTIGDGTMITKNLIDTTYSAMWKGIQIVRPGIDISDIGCAIQRFIESKNYSIVREYCGHGIGEGFHEEPQILHYSTKKTGIRLKSGMCFTIEPMVNAGNRYIELLSDNWTVITQDKMLSAQWEHTILVTNNGHEVLTFSKGEQ